MKPEWLNHLWAIVTRDTWEMCYLCEKTFRGREDHSYVYLGRNEWKKVCGNCRDVASAISKRNEIGDAPTAPRFSEHVFSGSCCSMPNPFSLSCSSDSASYLGDDSDQREGG